MRKVAVIASASGNGKTTFGRELARRLDVPFVELDALVHGPEWAETPDAELRAMIEPILSSDGWVIDGEYRRKLGDLVLRAAEVVVWLDLPIRVWLPRLTRRTVRRIRRRELLWNDNRETLLTAVWGRESLFGWAIRSHFRCRREWPQALSSYPVVRLRTPAEVASFVEATTRRKTGGLPVTVVLVTGMSGTGKSTALIELARRGHRVVDTDYGGWTEDVPASDGSGPDRRWREDRIAALLDGHEGGALFVSGCVSNQGTFYPRFDAVVLLSAPAEVILGRVATRETNPYGKTDTERRLILRDLTTVEPLLRAGATAEIDARLPPEDVADELERIAAAVTSR